MTQSDDTEQLVAELRDLWLECTEGIRRGDPPPAWITRLERIAALRERLETTNNGTVPGSAAR
jgi:hypothetical protein